MKTLALIILMSTAAWAEPSPPPLAELPPFSAVEPPAPLTVTEASTPGGLTVWVARRAGIPRVSVTLAVRGGSAVDDAGFEGMTELFAFTLTEGTRTRSAQKIAEDLQSVGADLQADWSPDAVFLQSSGLGGGAGRIIEVVADVARNAVFPDGEVALVKANLTQRLAESESTAEFIGDLVFARTLFGSHPYRTTHASARVIQSVTPEQLRRQLQRRFRPERALLVVVGDVEPAQIVEQVRAAFAGWKPEGSLPPPLPIPLPSPFPASHGGARRIVVVDRPGSVQSHLIVGRLAPTVGDPRFWPALAASTLFGGMGSARLLTNLREDKGYSYSPSSQLITLERATQLELIADVRTEVTAAALSEVLAELDRMRSLPPSAEELERAKRFVVGGSLVRNEAGEALADTLAKNWVLGLGPRSPSELVTHTEAVTLAELRRAGETLFPSLEQVVVVVGDAARLKSQLARLGKVTVVRP